MKRSLPFSLIAVTCVVLVGCDRCSKKADPAATTAAIDQPAATDPATAAQTEGASAPAAAAPAAEGPAELEKTDIKEGTGAEAQKGKKVSVFYTGSLLNGTVFDSSKDRSSPFSFVLGTGSVIAGWDQGIEGMKEGGKRKLVIPAKLAYGERAVGGVIPPNSTLVFEIELIKVE